MRAILLLLLLISSVLPAEAAGLGGPSTEASLLLAASQARPGDVVLGAVRLKMQPGWHVYWRNPGDSGTATAVQWTLPSGLQAGPFRWPVPQLQVAGPLVTYGYDDQVVLPVEFKIAADAKPGPLQISGEVSWLECKELCLPGEGTVSATLTVGTEIKPTPQAALLDVANQKLPKAGPSSLATAAWSSPAAGEERTVAIRWAYPRDAEPDFLPYEDQDIAVAAEVKTQADGFIKTLKKTGKDWPAQLRGVLVARQKAEILEAWEVTLGLQQPAAQASGIGEAAAAGPATKRSLWAVLCLAFLGGLILNIMPCVLPVLALKVLSFVKQSKESPARVRLLGLAYGGGVLACFVLLAVVAIGARQAGGLATWGMVLQNQVARVLLTCVMLLVSLNLFGVFEVVLGGRVSGAAGELAAREGLPGAFFNGLLAAVLATPCTAPFMGTALVFAFAQPAAITLLVFLFIGLGLAAPFVLLCWQPAWLKLMPKPGSWMERFKVAMGFPMLATTIWLFWFTAPRFGTEGVLFLGLFLVALAAAAWTFGEFVQRARRGQAWGWAVAVILVLAGYIGLLEKQLHWRSPQQENASGIDWKSWSPEAVRAAQQAGHPVLVDFTADNCLNCKLNKISSLEIPSTRNRLKELGVVAFLADFTDQDKRIAEVLRKYERAGVPLVLVYPGQAGAEPEVLPPILTPSIISEALDRAVGRKTAAR